MLVFIAGRNVPDEQVRRAYHQLGRMPEVFPQLDPATRCIWEQGPQFVAAIHINPAVAQPRRFLDATSRRITLYTGTAIDMSGRLQPADAASLAAHWEQLPGCLEGQFSVLHATAAPSRLCVLTDPLGIEPIYHYQGDGVCLVSNHVGLLSRTLGSFELDPLGAATFLALGWAAFDRTLCRGVRVLPGGRVTTWSSAAARGEGEPYFSLQDLANLRRRPFRSRDAPQLAASFVRMLRHLSDGLGPLHCPLTAGRDARVIAAALLQAGIPASYFTGGEPGSDDVQAGRTIAGRLGLDHQTLPAATCDVVGRWEELCHALITQNDGMISLWQAADILYQPREITRIRVGLWGLGGEIGRSFYGDPYAFVRARSHARITEFLLPRLIHSHQGLVRAEALSRVGDGVADHFQRSAEMGFRPLDLPDVFYLDERVRRWGGANGRKALPAGNHVTPFCTRPFVEAVFRMPPVQRYSEPIHWGLLHVLAPELLTIAPPPRPWRSQHWRRNWLRYATEIVLNRLGWPHLRKPHGAAPAPPPHKRCLEQGQWLEQRIARVRARCLETASDPLWELVDRKVLEQRLSPKTLPEERATCLGGLYLVETLCEYLAAQASEPG